MQQLNPKTGLPYKSTPKERELAKGYRIAAKQTVSGRAVVLVNNARARSLKKNISMEVSQPWVEKHLERGTCELTGLHFNLAPPPNGVTRRHDAPSLDRIDKDKPYTEDNTRVILWAVNCALSEYGTDTMLPILKAMVTGIENAKKNSTAPVSTGSITQSQVNIKPRPISPSGLGQDHNHTDNHSGTIQGQDADHSAQESGRDSLGRRSKEVGTLEAPKSIKDNGKPPNPNIWP